MKKKVTIIGRAERISLPDLGVKRAPAKVDTGADLSSLWASDIKETDAGLEFKVFGSKSPLYTGDTVIVPKGSFELTRVASSFGHREERFVIRTPIRLARRRILATFTLADRSNKTYPVLLGRRLLHGKFVVDVAEGRPLKSIEKAKKAKMRLELSDKNGKLKGQSL
jgi:hypothetical protein